MNYFNDMSSGLVGTSLHEAFPDTYSKNFNETESKYETVASTNVLTKGYDQTQNEYNSLDSTDNSEISVKAIDPSNNILESVDSKGISLSKKIVEYRLYLEQLENERTYVESQLNVFQKQLDETKESAPVVNSNSSLDNQGQKTNSSIIKNNPNLPLLIGTTGEQSEYIMNILFYIFLVLFGYLLAYRLKK